MTLVNSKDRAEQILQERARAASEAYPTRSDEQVRVRKVQRLDVDGVLARSFKNVKSISLAVDQQSFEQVKAR